MHEFELLNLLLFLSQLKRANVYPHPIKKKKKLLLFYYSLQFFDQNFTFLRVGDSQLNFTDLPLLNLGSRHWFIQNLNHGS